MDIGRKCAVVTGAAGGIGHAVVERLLSDGFGIVEAAAVAAVDVAGDGCELRVGNVKMRPVVGRGKP